MFNVNLNADLLGPDQASTFHHLVSKILFLCKRDHPDIQLAVGFFCRRIKVPHKDD